MSTDLREAPSSAPLLPTSGDMPPRNRRPDGSSLPPNSPPIRFREVIAVAVTVLLFDLWIYRGVGFAGYAAFILAACGLFLFGTPDRRPRAAAGLIGGMVLLLTVRLVWLGSPWLATIGFLLVAAFAMTLAGRRPYLLDLAIFAVQSTVAGLFAFLGYRAAYSRHDVAIPRSGWLKVFLPAATVFLFGTVFVLANPDVASAVARGLSRGWTDFWNAVARFSPEFTEVVLWGVVGVIAAGLLRPLLQTHLLAPLARRKPADPTAAEPLFESPLYAAYRNTLIAVIALFSAYLVFEFQTLWFRSFPKGFHYSGYAHQGAAWLTVALAMTTLVLSAIFGESTRLDPRLPRLRRYAWAWSALNLLLAVAVYHRMSIYVDFNGMTRMRTVGLFGISAVVIGFVLVVLKIVKDRDFAWLIERQLWTLAIAIFFLSITPIDSLVHSYNVRRILAGDPAPSVQISMHPLDAGGLLALPPLLQSENEIIREGTRAILANAARDRTRSARLLGRHWTGYQIADRGLSRRLQTLEAELRPLASPTANAAALRRFHDYAYQWY